MSRFLFAGRLLALPLALSLTACGDSLSLPSGASAGLPLPTPQPTVAITPVPTATPAPNPGAASCSLPPRADCGANGCCDEGGSPLFNEVIDNAQAELARTRPDIVGSNGDIRVDEVAYTNALATMLMRLNPGMCAVGGGGGSSRSKDEIGVKTDNNVSQNVDVIIGSSHRAWVGGRYTCRPASF